MKKISTLGFGVTVAIIAIAVLLTGMSVMAIVSQNNTVTSEESTGSGSEEVGSENLASSTIEIDTEITSQNNIESSEPVPVAEIEAAVTKAVENVDIEAVTSIETPSGPQIVTLAGGCFWCTESYLQETPGVIDAVSGYSGGSASDAFYKDVLSGNTGHREAVQVTYDPSRVTFDEILDAYWKHINPTDAGGQFADRGFQYTTAIIYHNEYQKIVAEKSKIALAASGLFDGAIATKIVPYQSFFPAEEYHQDYYQKSSEHYKRYEKGSGRAGFVDENWAKKAALEFLEAENQ